jgi:hypothetical protein
MVADDQGFISTCKGAPCAMDLSACGCSRRHQPHLGVPGSKAPRSTRRVLPATDQEHVEPPIMSMAAVLSIRHHLHVGDDTARLDKALAGVSNIGPTIATVSDRSGMLW